MAYVMALALFAALALLAWVSLAFMGDEAASQIAGQANKK
jgi:hypothetical protein